MKWCTWNWSQGAYVLNFCLLLILMHLVLKGGSACSPFTLSMCVESLFSSLSIVWKYFVSDISSRVDTVFCNDNIDVFRTCKIYLRNIIFTCIIQIFTPITTSLLIVRWYILLLHTERCIIHKYSLFFFSITTGYWAFFPCLKCCLCFIFHVIAPSTSIINTFIFIDKWCSQN